MPGVPRSIFRPFKDDMCMNPPCYFKDGKIRPWQQKQVVEASLHCAQYAVFSNFMKMKDRKLERFKRKILKRDNGTVKMLRATRKEMLKYKREACHI